MNDYDRIVTCTMCNGTCATTMGISKVTFLVYNISGKQRIG